MDTKALAFAIAGFLLGGFVVSVAATFEDEPAHSSTNQTSMSRMAGDLADQEGDAYDAAFITAMIEHHQGAIAMAQLSDERAQHRQIMALSDDIIAAQHAEITQMKQWRQQWGYDTSTGMDHSKP